MNFDIIEVFTRAWKITWKYKVLWIFGILASCGRSSGSNSNSSSRNQFTDNQASSDMMRQFAASMERATSWLEKNPWIIVAAVVIVLILWIIQVFLSTVGRVGLIRGAYQADKDVEKIQFSELFHESLTYFWRTIGLGLIVFLPIIVVLIGAFFAIVFSVSTSPNSAGAGFGIFSLFVGICCCFIPFMIMLGMYYTQSLRALILEDLGIFASLSRGWQVFQKNIGGLLLMAVILFFFNLIIGVVVSIPIIVAILPVMMSFFEGNITSWQPFIIAGIFVLLYSPLAWFLNGLLLTYTETIWTLIYIRVTQQKEEVPVIIEANA